MNKVPERLESLIGEKKFLQASLILTRSLKSIDREEMMEIEALSELRTYLQAQMNVSRWMPARVTNTVTEDADFAIV